MSTTVKITERDIKLLWGQAAGRCSYPQCLIECVNFLTDMPFIINEMAHIIAKHPSGPRGIPSGGANTYSNLILLCPTHHKVVDKAPEGTFTSEVLLQWKEDHETNVRRSLESPTFRNTAEVFRHIRRLLIENKSTWILCGPDSIEAKNNPFSNLAYTWAFRKHDTIIPNNRKIINCIYANRNSFDDGAYEIACEFIEHARGFEARSQKVIEGIPRFPKKFEELISGYKDDE